MLLVTTSYHLQAGSQSECTNQTVEIALRHLVNASKTDWVDHLPEVEFTMNNLPNASTKWSPMEFLTGLNARCALNAPRAPRASPAKPWSDILNELRREARDALLFAQTKMSIYYDNKRQDVSFKISNSVYIKLAKFAQSGYTLPNDTSRKLAEQRVGPFTILQTVGCLAYKLKIPPSFPSYTLSIIMLTFIIVSRLPSLISYKTLTMIPMKSGKSKISSVHASLAGTNGRSGESNGKDSVLSTTRGSPSKTCQMQRIKFKSLSNVNRLYS
jgi:hypothetical protein